LVFFIGVTIQGGKKGILTQKKPGGLFEDELHTTQKTTGGQGGLGENGGGAEKRYELVISIVIKGKRREELLLAEFLYHP